MIWRDGSTPERAIETPATHRDGYRFTNLAAACPGVWLIYRDDAPPSAWITLRQACPQLEVQATLLKGGRFRYRVAARHRVEAAAERYATMEVPR